MRKKLSLRIGCLLAAICLFVLECGAVGAAEIPVLITPQTNLEDLSQYDTDGDGLVAAIIVGSETNQSTSSNVGIGIQPLSTVTDNGVRLRSAPNTSATVLELMYQNEVVYVDLSNYSSHPGWHYLKRAVTGKWGYASATYIYL